MLSAFFHQGQLVQQRRRDRVQKTGGLGQQHATPPIEYINRVGQVQVPLGPRHGDIKQPTLLLQPLILAKRVDRRESSIHNPDDKYLSLIHISEPTRQAEISYAVFCLKKKKKK